MTEYVTSQSEIIRPADQTILLLQYINAEELLVPLLRQFLQALSFDTIFPNFKGVRISTIHPFVLLIAAETIEGATLPKNLFPSITIADMSDTETVETLGKDFSSFAITAEDIARLKGEFATGRMIARPDAFTLLESALAGQPSLAARHWLFGAQHTLHFNIWSDNKHVTSTLYDIVRQFLVAHVAVTHADLGIDYQAALSGRRSGDINVEFGKILYGANVSVPCSIRSNIMEVDLPTEIISDVGVLPTFYEAGEAE